MNGTFDSGGNLARLYREAIRQHAAHPVGYRQRIEATHRHEAYNPLCGDRVEVALQVRHGTIEAAAFDGEACAICMASASLLCSLAPGQTAPALRRISQSLQRALEFRAAGEEAGEGERGPTPRADRADSRPHPVPERLRPLLGVRPYPSRIRCATLPWLAALSALSG